AVLVVVVLLNPAAPIDSAVFPEPAAVTGHLHPIDDKANEDRQSEDEEHTAKAERDRGIVELLTPEQGYHQAERNECKFTNGKNDPVRSAESFAFRPPPAVLELKIERACQLQHHDQIPDRSTDTDHIPQDRNDAAEVEQM